MLHWRLVMADYKNIFKDALFLCPLCEKALRVKLTKKDKPYVVCDLCGIQLFIRGKEGVNALVTYLKETTFMFEFLKDNE